MRRRRLRPAFAALLLAALLTACANLTAEAPLFAVADQIGPAPITEGVWIALGEECPERNLRRARFPKQCSPIEITRLPDGAWSARFRIDLATGLTREEREQAEPSGPMRLVIVPAVERRTPDAYAPLYVAEIVPAAPDEKIAYAAITPLGMLPATSMHLIAAIDCAEILRDGPIEGVEAHYQAVEAAPAAGGESLAESTGAPGAAAPILSGCTASTQAAVREAARRALIENLATITDQRYVYVGRR